MMFKVADNYNSFNTIDLDPSGYDDGDGDDNKLTLNPGVSIQIKNGKKVLVMDDPAHPQLSEQYFYATWNSKYLANYQVIIWKQKITDLKDTPDAEKTYDFEARYLIEDVRPNFSDADQTTEFIDGHYTSMNYEGFTCNTNQTKIVNGVGTNERKVNSDGSTIVNVYNDRVNMKVTFYYKSSDLSGSSYETVGQDIYVKTDSIGRKPQYGKVNEEYVLLTPQENAEATYIYPYQYAPSNNTDATMFGIIDTADGKQEYVKLERKEIYSWHKSGYLYTPTTITTSNSTSTSSPTRSQYVTYNGGFSTIYSIRTKIYYYNLEHVKYQQPLKAYRDAYTPEKRDHYVFTGWYEDITCTQLFDFDKEKMPNANKVLYAGWAPERYLVKVDADGGQMDLGGTYSTYFRISWILPMRHIFKCILLSMIFQISLAK